MKEHIFKSYIGEDTEVFVDFDYQPKERAILSPIERAHPGTDEEVTITAVWVNPRDSRIDNLLSDLNQDAILRLTEAAYSFAHNMQREEDE